jgi:hypothetical protein
MPTTSLPNNNTITAAHAGISPSQNIVVNGGVTTGSLRPSHWSTTNTLNVPTSGRMELRGNQADIMINDVSLNDTLRSIQDRLNMLQPNTALEAEWDQLRELGEQYRNLEKQLIQKQRAWDILKKKEG